MIENQINYCYYSIVIQLFGTWVNKKGDRAKAKCPICKQHRFKLNDHLVRIHKMNPNTAKTIRSKSGQSHLSRQASRKRIHRPVTCPIASCGKTIKRPHNHLKDTHKITDPILYKKFLSKIIPQNGKWIPSSSICQRDIYY